MLEPEVLTGSLGYWNTSRTAGGRSDLDSAQNLSLLLSVTPRFRIHLGSASAVQRHLEMLIL